MVDVDRIVELARECIGTPFVHQGRQCGVGLDCAGEIEHVLKNYPLPYNDNKGYPRRPFDGQLVKTLDAEPSLKRIPKADMARGDLVVMRISKAPQHLGIFTGETIIHTYAVTGRVVEQRIANWLTKITHVYRIVE
jgi:cell wall-associated NlpC family hydrolase